MSRGAGKPRLVRKSLALSALLLVPSVAHANDTASVDLVLQGAIAPRCGFSDAPDKIAINADIADSATVALGFACNLADAGNVTLTVTSANGALVSDTTSSHLRYALSWTVDGTKALDGFFPSTDPAQFAVAAQARGAASAGTLTVRLTAPVSGLEAGSYSDLLTFTLSP